MSKRALGVVMVDWCEDEGEGAKKPLDFERREPESSLQHSG
jgi:hypothetical protein